ncbi:MAG TPA: hypothetical protein EYN66_15705, partial [Myxococcales bacterium]|nr:hypothetical protein [Myxococcales bacterium]
MAVAAHVSRVAKDYAPHGYSVMEDIVVRHGKINAGSNMNKVAFVGLDGDCFIEEACVIFDANNTPAWQLTLNNATTSTSLSSSSVSTAVNQGFVLR